MIKHWSRLDFGALAIYLLVVIGGPIAILASIADSAKWTALDSGNNSGF